MLAKLRESAQYALGILEWESKHRLNTWTKAIADLKSALEINIDIRYHRPECVFKGAITGIESCCCHLEDLKLDTSEIEAKILRMEAHLEDSKASDDKDYHDFANSEVSMVIERLRQAEKLLQDAPTFQASARHKVDLTWLTNHDETTYWWQTAVRNYLDNK